MTIDVGRDEIVVRDLIVGGYVDVGEIRNDTSVGFNIGGALRVLFENTGASFFQSPLIPDPTLPLHAATKSYVDASNPFDQSLNTTDSPTFGNVNVTGDLVLLDPLTSGVIVSGVGNILSYNPGNNATAVGLQTDVSWIYGGGDIALRTFANGNVWVGSVGELRLDKATGSFSTTGDFQVGGDLTVIGFYGGAEQSTTISSGSITATTNAVGVATEGGAPSDNLDNVNGVVAGRTYIIRNRDNNTINIRNNAPGNIRTKSGGTITLFNTDDVAQFYCRSGGVLVEV